MGKQTKLRMRSATGVLGAVGQKVKKLGGQEKESMRISLPLKRPVHQESETEGRELGGFIKQVKNGLIS